MKTTEWRNLTDEELHQRRLDTLKELFHLRLQKTAGQLERPSRIRDRRRDVARANTLLQERRKAAK